MLSWEVVLILVGWAQSLVPTIGSLERNYQQGSSIAAEENNRQGNRRLDLKPASQKKNFERDSGGQEDSPLSTRLQHNLLSNFI